MKKNETEKLGLLGWLLTIFMAICIFFWNSFKEGFKFLKLHKRFISGFLIGFIVVKLVNSFILTNHFILKGLLLYCFAPAYIVSLGLVRTIKNLFGNKKSKEAKEVAKLLAKYDWIKVIDVEDRGERKNILVHSTLTIDAMIKHKALLEHSLNTNIINIKNLKSKDIVVLETMAILTDDAKKLLEVRKIIGDASIDIFASDKTDTKNVDYYMSRIYLDAWKSKEKQIAFLYKAECIEITCTKQNNIKLIAYKNALKAMNWDETLFDSRLGIFKIGESLSGSVFINFNNTANVLIGGEPGGGKTVVLKLIAFLAIKQGARVFIGDFKGLDFWDFENLAEIITEHERLLKVLKLCMKEHRRRIALFRDVKADKLSTYNERTGENLERWYVFIDELGEAMEVLSIDGDEKDEKELQKSLAKYCKSLARLCRATGINLVFGTQRPDVGVLEGQTRDQFGKRICFRTAAPTLSQTVLNSPIACEIPENTKGRAYVKEDSTFTQTQIYYLGDNALCTELKKIRTERKKHLKLVKNSDTEFLQDVEENETEPIDYDLD